MRRKLTSIWGYLIWKIKLLQTDSFSSASCCGLLAAEWCYSSFNGVPENTVFPRSSSSFTSTRSPRILCTHQLLVGSRLLQNSVESWGTNHFTRLTALVKSYYLITVHTLTKKTQTKPNQTKLKQNNKKRQTATKTNNKQPQTNKHKTKTKQKPNIFKWFG